MQLELACPNANARLERLPVHAAARAEANGRGDWADALRTGRVGRTDRDPACR